MGRLTLTDPEQLLETGVEVEARPAGRNVRRLSLLSGGERSLVAMAFLFAIFRSRPSPFYLMDEVEVALDDVNLQRFLALVPRVPRGGPAHHREPPEADHGGGRRPLRRDQASGRLLAGPEPSGCRVTDDSPLPDGFGSRADGFGNGNEGFGSSDPSGTHAGPGGPPPAARTGPGDGRGAAPSGPERR